MKKITLSTLLILVLCFFSGQLKAQDGYTYTLVDNGAYSYTIAAVPNASASNFATSVQSYGFTIIVPDGVTATITSSLGSSAGATFFNGTDVAQPTIDGYLITETLGSPGSLPAPSSGTTSPIVTIQINGSPTSGILYILANNSALATAVTPLKAFMQADMIDDAMASFTNVVDPNASALTTPFDFDFATLSTPTAELVGVSVYPNPTTDKLNITGVTDITNVEVTNINGQLVLKPTSNLETIDMSSLQTGLYFVKVQTLEAQKTIKVVKQ
ncbi:T9SS type A sorting domain-containing protein [Kordia sp. YSTF-M3]|uniref:T9SS type A sorting domain-containing protein n=1 Tax=Kordia aestuariivivens TaxID=2759037 RepID=A0ABR7QG02_9FLAO|nr:T9SS type A sorting domain-containing protein [Kordia aestuariivivens]MBC8757438.1 T9SS type A sorting domain-containing protein [Kordia aestuariivivens]